jgi:hypothetical protein
MLNSGKELFLDISLKEAFSALDEVEVKAKIPREEAMNPMATLSARTFSMEEARRFAGGMDDPSRLASTYAGVTPSGLDNNEIVIRGNAAKGILWQLEGVEIPAPNHLAGMFSGGGINTMFSSNILANSDFFTGAFPAEYGNATSGVFDLKLRNGNSDKREYAFQVGSMGIDFALEGPFKKDSRASYLINYRYSTIGLLQGLMPNITGLPTYSDLSMKFYIPSKKAGIFSLWSINGKGNIKSEMSRDTLDWETNMDSYQYNIAYDMTSSGINNRYIFNETTYLFTGLTFSATRYTNDNNYYLTDLTEIPVTNQDEVNSRLSLTSYINKKFNRRHTNRTGVIVNRLSYNFDVANNTNVPVNPAPDFFVNSKGGTYSARIYSQSKYYITENININAGIHLSYTGLNNEIIAEPRAGINWRFKPGHSLNFAYGKHSRMEPLRIYMMEVPVGDNYEQLNKDLKITKAHHFILGYDVKLGKYTHLNTEIYYQKLYDVPVIPDSTFSMLNYTSEDFFAKAMTNDGTGRNYGIDLTLEQFLNRGFYYMMTSSVYSSKYVDSNDDEWNTKYDQRFVFNALGGKEWKFKNDNIFGVNGKLTILGGKRQYPVDYEKSKKYKYVIYDGTKPYTVQLPAKYFVDVSFSYTVNRPIVSHSIILQAKNLLMQEESFGHAYNFRTGQIESYGLTIVYPYISYRIQF